MQYEYIQDAGHGWLKVPLTEVKGLDISGYSYMDSTHAYLEEDCDMGVFCRSKGWETWEQIAPHVKNVYHQGESRVRSLRRYEAEKVIELKGWTKTQRAINKGIYGSPLVDGYLHESGVFFIHKNGAKWMTEHLPSGCGIGIYSPKLSDCKALTQALYAEFPKLDWKGKDALEIFQTNANIEAARYFIRTRLA